MLEFASPQDRLLHTIEACNGEIRIMASRYSHPDWYCLLAIVEQPDELWERWEDLVCGDNDFFEAITFFKNSTSNDFVFVQGSDPASVMSSAIDKAADKLLKVLEL